ncbi:heterokaryon incompatibility protein het-E-1 [Fusarium sp. NRRL 25303]|nr:heterokaryon incompatibility protein het-E-1 [Fusarium sp. NRRL 25303]
MKIHNLTRTDILTFSGDRLESHPRWVTYRSRDEQLQSIVETIADRAQGVFLWAFLVTKSLQDGLTNGDTAQQLGQRLDNLPTSLRRLFKYMIDQFDSSYNEKMAGMFALYAQEPLRLDLYGFHDMEYEDEDYALRCLVKERSVGKILDLYEETRQRINTWANGLLECNQGNKVDFLHRTVSDFLRTGDMLSYLEVKRRPDFDVYFSITKAYIAYIKSTRFSGGNLRMTPQAIIPAHFRMEVGGPKLVFREDVLRSNAASYVAKKLVDIPDYLSKLVLAPLSVAVAAEILPADTIRVLLQHVSGCNFTVFAMYLMTVSCVPGYIRQSDEYLRTLNSFLTAGANLGAEKYLNSSDLRLSSLVRWWPNKGEESSVFDAFLQGLQAWVKMDGMRQTNGRFMSEVVRTILVHEKTPRHYVSSLGAILLQVFSEHIAKPLLRMISDASGNCQDPSEKDKKRQCETRDILDCDKRRKKES